MRKVVTGVNPVTADYSYGEGGQLLGEYSATGTAQAEYIYLDSTPIAVAKGTALAYVETDHLGTPRQVVDPATNNALWTWDGLASTFGVNAPNQSPTGGAAYVMNLRFPGQYYDAETGLNYNYFRDYEPATGRYAESDPIGLFGGSSTYGYARNRSINFVDREGLIAGTVPLPWIWEIPPWAKSPLGLCLFAVTYSTPLSSNDEITPAVPQPGTCPNTQPPANDSHCRTSDYCRQTHDMLEAWRLGLISELSELLGDTQGALGADPGWAALHQWIIQDIRNFNEAVDKYNAICDPKIDRFANRPIP